MSSNLRVAELRKELAKRGLDTTGLKTALVERLDDAISSETKNDAAADEKPDETADETTDGNENATQSKPGRGKRARDDDRFSESNVKRMKVEEIDELTVNELRQALTALDCPTEGTKKVLKKRLLEAVNEDSLPDGDKTNDADAKVVTAIKRGRGVLDPHIPDHMKANSEIVWDSDSDDVYVAMLNQTNVGGNNNKFYVIQALQDSSNSFFVFTRWGRVGAVGQKDLTRCSSKSHAIMSFEQKFEAKTSNAWSARHDFQPRKGKYTWLEMDYGSDDEEQKADKPPPVKVKIVESDKLNPLVRELLKTISDRAMMSSLMSEIGYDTNKLPLGKLGKSTISKGYEVLKRLSAALEGKKKLTELQELTSEFYTVIPHDFGRKSMSAFTIDTPAKLKRKLEMVEALGNIELASKILQAGESETEEDPLLRQYEEMNCEIEPLAMTSDEADWILAYTNNSHSVKTHGHFNLEVQQIYKINRQSESDRFKPFSKVKNRMLLWHGSRLCNWIGILSQGLRIAPPEAPVNGYMFGKGVYFADMVSKSAGYCCASGSNSTALLLLSEVALGDMRELNNSDYKANQLPPGKLSTKGVGTNYPNPKGNKVLSDGVVVPLGKPVQDSSQGRCLAHHEYIVYDVAQIHMKYLLMVKFKYN